MAVQIIFFKPNETELRMLEPGEPKSAVEPNTGSGDPNDATEREPTSV